MKKITALLALLMLVGALAGCGKQNDTNKTDKLSIVTTIFPEYDWVRAVLGDKADNAEVTMLLDNGVDLHSYQPTADDIVKISDCDLFIYVGGESDGWVNDALKNATNKNMKVINLLDVLGDSVKTEEVVEGMQETEHDHDHDHAGHHHADEVFTSWGVETPKKFSEEEIREKLNELDDCRHYGTILRAKGFVDSPDGEWVYFDYVPGEVDIRRGGAAVTGRICVIGSKINEQAIKELFNIE